MKLLEYEILAPLFEFTYSGLVDQDKLFTHHYDFNINDTPEDYKFFDENICLKNFNFRRDYTEDDNEFFSPFNKYVYKY